MVKRLVGPGTTPANSPAAGNPPGAPAHAPAAGGARAKARAADGPMFVQRAAGLGTDLEVLDAARRRLGGTVDLRRAEGAFRVARPLKVAVLCLGGMGGSGSVARVAAEGLGRAGHKVSLLTLGEAFCTDAALEKVTVAAVSVPPSPIAPADDWVGRLRDEIVAHVRREKTDVINVHYGAGLAEAAVAAREVLRAEGHKVSVAVTLHGTDVTGWGRNPETRERVRASVHAADAVSAVSHVLARQAVEAFGLEVQPPVISNAIDPFHWNPTQWSDLRARLAPNGEVIIAHASNLRPVKRPLDAVRVLADVRAQGIDAKLMLIGDGPMLEAMHELAVELGVAEKIMVMGAIEADKLPKYMAAADLHLVTSENESFCLAAMEAMACGVPVVGTHCGGLDEIMTKVDPGLNRVSKLLADVGDAPTMARSVVSLVTDERRYKRVQGECLATAHREYPRDRQVQGYLTLVDDARPASR
jgi:N-acetyl-alpha-D-glucosaminyl L-malate synthase BshA